ncbi:hypothetical protein JCM33374_g5979 [Metschnikowia sp. JCM 33374]|nr:hypothetical protein JCM33374_g5979 [Metschnikowia sp. JCM 33374]
MPGSEKDAGNKPNDHYKSRLSTWRYTLRYWCLPIVREETQILARMQEAVRTPLLDAYFAWTANLASHTFYVLMLPPSFWFGASSMGRDLVFVLGMGIYITGFCKDLLCLPRPRSPPLHRITMSSYTAQEYGWPSSHSANATAVTLVLLAKVLELHGTMSVASFYGLLFVLALYYFSLIVGRLYCGMHGFFDIAAGIVIGTGLFFFRFFYGAAYDEWLLFSSRNTSWFGIVGTVSMIILGHLSLIHIYPEPVDDCPCFDDSVAFVGVLIGLDLAHYTCVLTGYFAAKNEYGDPLLIPFDSGCSPVVALARFVVGVGLVVLWKSLSKPVIFTILPPLYKMIGVNLPRSHFISTAHTKKSNRQVRSQSLSNMKNEPLADLDSVLNPITVTMSPENDIDAYELLDYQAKNSSATSENGDVPVKISGVFRPRYDVEIIGRTIIYAGIAVMAVWGLGLSVVYLNLI